MHETHPGSAAAKETRLSVRITPAQKAMIARAARLRGTTVTDFVVRQAFDAASRLVADETQLRMTPEQFKQFCRVLDAAPARNLKAMQQLLSEPSVLDE